MRIHPFAKDAGLRLFAPAFTERVSQQARQAPHDAALQTEAGAAERLAAVTIEAYVRAQDLDVCGLRVLFDGARCTVHVQGQAAHQASREKAVLCCGNVQGVAQVHDLMTVVAHAGCSRFHRVSNGDSLPQIAEHCYGDAACWPRILDANRPMLHAPDHIYSGQVLRIPA
ncbi:MAG: LysM peptidoglycan-binding domain-containing protein [Rubrivivax sp.]|nr:LysM peptidoglycan-binding domain-containing protein [Rubrivivax sp.]MBK7261554.1 LysM peptidoglycan-binding domain-containing protein [Rubrivivax sp.]MBK8529383.1 LysM peptidoglycan-binding domain-containing protein [Rubrivivax sp.]